MNFENSQARRVSHYFLNLIIPRHVEVYFVMTPNLRSEGSKIIPGEPEKGPLFHQA